MSTTRKPAGTRVTVAFGANIVVQVVLIVVGLVFIAEAIGADDALHPLLTLFIWCLVASVHALTIGFALAALARRPASDDGSPAWQLAEPVHVLSLWATLLVSAVGVFAAVEVLLLRADPDYGPAVAVCGVWAMILAWGLLHWGFAQLYFQQYRRASEPPLVFPRTPAPGLIEFAYFAFTVGTSFAASDVEVCSTRTRFQVLIHSIASFFFNSLIIVLAVNTILSAVEVR